MFFVGSGKSSYVKKLEKRVHELNLAKRIIFFGQKKDPVKILKFSDIGVLVSNEEGFSNTILEYMSFSLPVIATNVGGNSEVIKNGLNGFLIEKNNIQQLKKKLVLLIQNNKLRRKMGQSGYEIIKEKFKLQNTANMYKNYYDQLFNHN